MCMFALVLFAAAITSSCGANVEESDKIIFPFVSNSVKYAKNELCKAQSELYTRNLENLTLWAHEMWDASAKYTTGLLRGSVYQLGDWDECITIKGPFKTQYCLATITANVPSTDLAVDPLSLYHSPYETVLNRIHKTEDISQKSRDAIQVALCIPASCSSKDLEDSLNEYLENIENPLESYNVTYSATVLPQMCQTQTERKSLDSWDMTFCTLSIIIVLLVLLSTIYDYVQTNPKSTSKKVFLTSFSVLKNFPDLPKADEGNPSMMILHGMRTFSMFVLIMCHRLITIINRPILNYNFVEEQYRSPLTPFLFQGNLFVDSFFVLSGLLVTYGFMVQLDKKFMNPLVIVLVRYVRLTPIYAFVMFYYATMFYHTGSGPLWKLVVVPEVQNCRNNWWINLLYIGNYVRDDQMCLLPTWYLQSDFHYLIIGLFVVWVIHKHKRIGFGILTCLFIVSIIVPFALTVIYKRPALLQYYPEVLKAPRIHPDFKLIYIKSHARAAPYFVGMFAGYIYYRLKDTPKYCLSKFTSHCLTFVSAVILIAVCATGGIFHSPYYEYDVIESATYAALHRMAWAVGTVGLLISASYGHCTILKVAMSWSPWIPLGKLTYAAFLIHMHFMLRNLGMAPVPMYLNFLDVINLILGDIALTYIVALFLYLGIESPIRRIVKALMTPWLETPAIKQSGQKSIVSNKDCDVRL